jgi:hypothetical protein
VVAWKASSSVAGRWGEGQVAVSSSRASRIRAVSVITEAWVRDKDKESDVSRPADAIYAIDISPVGSVEVGAVRVVATAQGLGFERMEPDPSVKERASLFSPWRTAQ